MANIDVYLKRILSAIYGEEVRGSIHDAIEAINEESIPTESWDHSPAIVIDDDETAKIAEYDYENKIWDININKEHYSGIFTEVMGNVNTIYPMDYCYNVNFPGDYLYLSDEGCWLDRYAMARFHNYWGNIENNKEITFILNLSNINVSGEKNDNEYILGISNIDRIYDNRWSVPSMGIRYNSSNRLHFFINDIIIPLSSNDWTEYISSDGSISFFITLNYKKQYNKKLNVGIVNTSISKEITFSDYHIVVFPDYANTFLIGTNVSGIRHSLLKSIVIKEVI